MKKTEEIKEKRSLKKELINVFYIIMIIIFILTLYKTVFNNHTTFAQVKPLVLFLCCFIYLAFSFLLYKVLSKIKKHNKVFVVIMFLILIVVQFVFAYIFEVAPKAKSWDFGSVYEAAVNDVEGLMPIEDNSYFYQYTNNIGLALFFKFIFSIAKIFNFTNYTLLGLILNIAFIDIAIVFLYKIIRNNFDEKISRIFFLFTITFSPFITYVPIYYTDTLSLPFAISAIYFLMKYVNNPEKKTSWLVICGLLIGIGSCIKFTVFFIFLAIILYYVFRENQDKIKNVLKQLVIIFFATIIPLVCLNGYIKLNFDQKRLEKESFPFTHWIMMGMTGWGGYTYEDTLYTKSFEEKKDKEEANVEQIKERFTNLIETRTLDDFYALKAVYSFGDGTFYSLVKLERDQVRDFKMKKYVLQSDNNDNYIFKTICQTQLVIVLFFMLVGMILRKYLTSRQRDLQLLVNISIIGLYIFLLIWEARSRYVVNYVPLLLLSSYFGVEALKNFISSKRKVEVLNNEEK